MKFVITLVLLTVLSANSLTITNYGQTTPHKVMYIDEVVSPPVEGEIQNKTIEFKPVRKLTIYHENFVNVFHLFRSRISTIQRFFMASDTWIIMTLMLKCLSILKASRPFQSMELPGYTLPFGLQPAKESIQHSKFMGCINN